MHVLYCSGDVHGGNVVRTYNDRWGVPVEQKGLANAQSVLAWTKQMQATGALASTFSELVVMGCSAGSIGAQLWGKQVVSALKWQRAAVVPDSYAGIFPEGSTGPLMYNFGFCSSGFLSESLLAKCLAKELTIEEMDLEFMAATPTVPYTFIQSKVDVVQRSFFRAIAFTGNYSDNAMSPAIFYDDVSTLFGSYNTHLDNFLVYLVDGHNHCYTPRETFYLTDATSPWDNGKGSEGIMLHDWTAQLPLRNGASISTVCAGEVKSTQVCDICQQLRFSIFLHEDLITSLVLFIHLFIYLFLFSFLFFKISLDYFTGTANSSADALQRQQRLLLEQHRAQNFQRAVLKESRSVCIVYRSLHTITG